MVDEGPKRKRGRPRKEGTDVPLTVNLPKHHFDYLEFLALKKNRLGASAKQAAQRCDDAGWVPHEGNPAGLTKDRKGNYRRAEKSRPISRQMSRSEVGKTSISAIVE
jgi:hypothetical protein